MLLEKVAIPGFGRMRIVTVLTISVFVRRYIYGQRAVFIKHSIGTGTTSEPSRTAEVFDFSLAAVLSAQGSLDTRSASPRGQPGKLLPASAIRTEDVPLFLDDVETHLPCVISTLHLTQSCSACMIYADGIIGVNVRPALSLPWEFGFFPRPCDVISGHPSLTFFFVDQSRW
jgi:hypothetical protein